LEFSVLQHVGDIVE